MTTTTIDWNETFSIAKKRKMSVRVHYADITQEIHDIGHSHGFVSIEELNMVRFFLPKT